MSESPLTVLGRKVTKFEHLETFPKPALCVRVTLVSDEMTAVCPVTEQPDWYTVRFEYEPRQKCVESKTFKLFVQSFRERGQFCEALASHMLTVLVESLDPLFARLTLVQKARGGVSIESVSEHLSGR